MCLDRNKFLLGNLCQKIDLKKLNKSFFNNNSLVNYLTHNVKIKSNLVISEKKKYLRKHFEKKNTSVTAPFAFGWRKNIYNPLQMLLLLHYVLVSEI